METNLKRLLRNGAYLYSIVLVVFGLFALGYDQYWLAAAEGLAAIALVVIMLVLGKMRAKGVREYVQASVERLSSAATGAVSVPMLAARLDTGEVLWHNKPFSEAAGIDDPIIGGKLQELLPEFSYDWLLAGKAECDSEQLLQGKRYRVFGSLPADTDTEGQRVLLQFIDCTELYRFRDEYLRSRPIVAIILIDNYDELTNNLPDTTVSNLNAGINTHVGAWADEVGGLLRKLERNRFLFVFEAKDLFRITDKKFALLDSIREVVNPSGIAATVSLGLGKDGAGFQEDYQYASLALEMALSRGGDQAVIKDKINFSFFGGRSREAERHTKVKARVLAGSLTELIAQSSRVFIMGHKNADADAVGAAAGLCALCRKNGVKVNIVINLKANAAGSIIRMLRQFPEYRDMFISPQDALVLADAMSLLIVVDTNRPDQVESQPLMESMNRLAVIDHHRRAADYIARATLTYHEPFASSTSELVTELLTYAAEPQDMLNGELEALLAGIVLDTKNFGVRVNSRTFEAAAFLRRLGADPVEVKKLFQDDFNSTVARYKIIQDAQVYRERIAVSAVDREITRVLAGRAADELLNIAGIETSFVLFKQAEQIYISARSIGEINVQVVLEPLGGGGNAAAAGAQLKGMHMEDAKLALVNAIDRYFKTES